MYADALMAVVEEGMKKEWPAGYRHGRCNSEVQDAPRYGAERRVIVSVHVRHGERINERGITSQPDLVVVADDSRVGLQRRIAGSAPAR